MNGRITWNTPFSDIFRRMEAIMNYDYDKESRGLKTIIHRPHNLITKKDENGNITSCELQVVYTPFKKSDVKVNVLDGVLNVKCGSENIEKNEDMTYCGISHQSYEFSLPLGDTVDESKITAKAEDGMLYITLPMKEEVKKEALQIEIA